jgi:hypothetical protein
MYFSDYILTVIYDEDKQKKNKNTTQHMLDSNMHKQTQIAEIKHNKLEVKTNLTSFLSGNRTGHHNMEHRT